MITYEDAAELLALAAARDQRTVGKADLLAWQADLNAAGVTRADAEAALVEFYARHTPSQEPERRYRVTTPDVISIARRLRRDRLENFVYEPNPDETPQQYLARLRDQIAAVASGQQAAPIAAPALEGAPHPSVALAAAGVGREVPGEPATVRRPGPHSVTCPKCQAPVGRPCRLPDGKKRDVPHPARRRVSRGEPASIDGGA